MRGQLWSTILGGVVGGLAVLTFQGTAHSAANPDKINTHELNIVDYTGKVRIDLRCDSNNEPRIRLLDEKGEMRAVLGLGSHDTHENPFMYLIENDRVKADISLSAEDGAPTIYLNGRDGAPRVFLSAAPDGKGDAAQMVVYGNKKGNRTQIVSTEGDSGVSSFKENVLRTYAGVMPQGIAGFLTNDEAGQPVTVDGVTDPTKEVIVKLKRGHHVDMLNSGDKSTDAKTDVPAADKK